MTRAALALVLAASFTLVLATSASADPGRDGNAEVVLRDKASFVLVPRPGIAKADYDPGILAARMRRAPAGVRAASYDVYLSNSGSIPLGNGSVTTNFNGTWTLPFDNTYTVVSYGDEHGQWTGTVPAYNADYMDLSGTYTAWAYQSSVSVSVPAGFTWSASGASATANWQNRFYVTWSVDHYFQPGPTFYPGDRVTRVIESSSTSATFGSSTYTTNATANSWI